MRSRTLVPRHGGAAILAGVVASCLAGASACSTATFTTAPSVAVDASSDAAAVADASIDAGADTSRPAEFLVGDKTLYPADDGAEPGRAEAFQVRAGAGGVATEIGLYVSHGVDVPAFTIGLYTDTATHAPGTLLTTAMVAVVKPGAWNVASIAPTPIVAKTLYWIAFVAPAQGGGTKLPFRIQGSGAASRLSMTSASTTLTSLPVAWTTDGMFDDGPPSAFVR